METRKAQLVRLTDGSLFLVPLEEVINGFFDWYNRDKRCDFIKINPPKVNLWMYRSYNGKDIMWNDDHVASPPTEEEVTKILKEHKGICYIEVTDSNEISTPSNGLGNRAVIIHLSQQAEEISKSA